MGSHMRVRCVPALLLLACSSSSPKSRPDAWPDSEPTPADGPDIIRVPEPHQEDAAGEVGPLCPTVTTVAYDAGKSPIPLDWPSAQSLSSWCSLNMDWPRTRLCLGQSGDGYNVAVLAFRIGGEMMIVNETFFLYDPVTGKLVAQLMAEPPLSGFTCAFRTPDGPPNPALNSQMCMGGQPLQPVCAPTRDAGVF